VRGGVCQSDYSEGAILRANQGLARIQGNSYTGCRLTFHRIPLSEQDRKQRSLAIERPHQATFPTSSRLLSVEQQVTCSKQQVVIHDRHETSGCAHYLARADVGHSQDRVSLQTATPHLSVTDDLSTPLGVQASNYQANRLCPDPRSFERVWPPTEPSSRSSSSLHHPPLLPLRGHRSALSRGRDSRRWHVGWRAVEREIWHSSRSSPRYRAIEGRDSPHHQAVLLDRKSHCVASSGGSAANRWPRLVYPIGGAHGNR